MSSEKERLDRAAEEAREKMLRGEETPWLHREPHRGQEPRTEGGEYIDPVEQGPGGAGGVSFGSGSGGQGSASARGGGGSTGGRRQGHGVDAPGAFGKEGSDDTDATEAVMGNDAE